jgi:hypothetical protein
VKAAAVRREVWRDIMTGTARTAIFALALGLLVLGLVAVEQLQVRRLVEDATAFRAAGASVVTMSAEGRIRGEACERLGEVPGVRAAGALSQRRDGLRLATLPQSPLTLYSVSPGLPAVLAAVSDGNGVILSDDAVAAAGRSPGDTLATADGTTRIAGSYAYPADGRRIGFGYAALDVTRADAFFDECWVEAWPIDDHIEALLLTVVRPDAEDDADLQLSQLNTTLGTTFDGAAVFDSRATSAAWAVAAGAALAIGYLSVRIRRVAIASALHTRVPRGALAAILALETAAWVLPVIVVAAAATAVFAATGEEADQDVAFLLTARIVAPAVATSVMGAGIAFLTTRERHLFRYVKDR